VGTRGRPEVESISRPRVSGASCHVSPWRLRRPARRSASLSGGNERSEFPPVGGHGNVVAAVGDIRTDLPAVLRARYDLRVTFVPIPDSWRASLVFKYNVSGNLAVNTLGIQDAALHDVARANVIAGALKGWWNTSVKPNVSAGVQLVQIYMLDHANPAGPTAVYTTGLPIAGSSGTNAMAAPASPIITFRTSSGRGRSYRGRNYAVGAIQTATNSDGDSVSAAAVAAWQAAYVALGPAMAAITCQHGVLSPRLAAIFPVTSYECRTYLGAQRRRATSP